MNVLKSHAAEPVGLPRQLVPLPHWWSTSLHLKNRVSHYLHKERLLSYPLWNSGFKPEELGKYFLSPIFETSSERVFAHNYIMAWDKHETSSRHLRDSGLEDVSRFTTRILRDKIRRHLRDIFETMVSKMSRRSWRCLEDVSRFTTRLLWGPSWLSSLLNVSSGKPRFSIEECMRVSLTHRSLTLPNTLRMVHAPSITEFVAVQ